MIVPVFVLLIDEVTEGVDVTLRLGLLSVTVYVSVWVWTRMVSVALKVARVSVIVCVVVEEAS